MEDLPKAKPRIGTWSINSNMDISWRTENMHSLFLSDSGTIYNSQTPIKRWMEQNVAHPYSGMSLDRRETSVPIHSAMCWKKLDNNNHLHMEWLHLHEIPWMGKSIGWCFSGMKAWGTGRDCWEALVYPLGEMRNSRIHDNGGPALRMFLMWLNDTFEMTHVQCQYCPNKNALVKKQQQLLMTNIVRNMWPRPWGHEWRFILSDVLEGTRVDVSWSERCGLQVQEDEQIEEQAAWVVSGMSHLVRLVRWTSWN